jgi:arsenate reductase (thioredoxin)
VTDKPSVLFACVANSGRSVAARVLAAYYGGDAVEAVSAGSEPGEHIHPEVAHVLVGLGLDVSREKPKGFDPDGTYTAVVTMGCGDECPYYSGARYEDWPLDDPKGQDEATVRRIVADIDSRVRQLLAQLAPDHDPPPSVLEQAPGAGSA